MENQKHTKWSLWNDGSVIKSGGAIVALVVKESDARRIVACVNACDGLTTDFLETPDLAFAPAHTAAKMAEIEQQRDQMLAALEKIANWDQHTIAFAVDFGSNGVRDFYRDIARKEVTKITGES